MAVAVARTNSNPMKRVFGIRDFFLLFAGQTTSLLGDQFYTIAIAWLVLKITGDPLALGLVIALATIPGAIFTLIGGAITDRVSPRRVMLLADIIRLILTAVMALQIFSGALPVWMLYLYSLVFGIVGGVFAPASMSMVPTLVSSEDLQAGNSVMQGSMQLIKFVGPAAAGALVAAFPLHNLGVGLAIALDALTFIASVITLWMMQAGRNGSASSRMAPKASVWVSIKEGLAYMLKDPAMRIMFLLIAVANFAFGGPVVVGIPFLANTRFPEGAAAYGLIISGYAGGNLLGIILSGSLPKMKQQLLKVFLVVMFLLFAAGTGGLAWVAQTWLAFAVMLLMGILNGYLSILLVTGLQRNTPREMLGRIMSMVLLANLVFMPLSQTIAGAVLRWNVPVLFVGAGLLMAMCAIYLMVPKVGSLLSTQLGSNQSSPAKTYYQSKN
jgi:MFS family permease